MIIARIDTVVMCSLPPPSCRNGKYTVQAGRNARPRSLFGGLSHRWCHRRQVDVSSFGPQPRHTHTDRSLARQRGMVPMVGPWARRPPLRAHGLSRRSATSETRHYDASSARSNRPPRHAPCTDRHGAMNDDGGWMCVGQCSALDSEVAPSGQTSLEDVGRLLGHMYAAVRFSAGIAMVGAVFATVQILLFIEDATPRLWRSEGRHEALPRPSGASTVRL
jgi:hypothetical protein